MRILHTSDWHLGHRLYGLDRTGEHRAFLEWLLEALDRERADALLICGDVFDSANPPASAQHLLYDFLNRARTRFPRLDILVVAGNHDSPARLDAAAPLAGAARIHLVGALPRLPGGGTDLERALIPLSDAAGVVAAWVLAVPYLRPADLGTGDAHLVARMASIYRELTRAALGRRAPGQALVATGHLFLEGAALSSDSERTIQAGYRAAPGPAFFPAELAYVALGHLHRAQRAFGEPRLRYSGAPIPLAMSERDYTQQVVMVELRGERLERTWPLAVPRHVDLLSIPPEPAPLAQVLLALNTLPRSGEGPPPYLEVRVRLDAPTPWLRQKIEAAAGDAHARLVRIQARAGPPHPGSVQRPEPVELNALSPEDVFARCWAAQRGGPIPAGISAAFRALVARVRQTGPQ